MFLYKAIIIAIGTLLLVLLITTFPVWLGKSYVAKLPQKDNVMVDSFVNELPPPPPPPPISLKKLDITLEADEYGYLESAINDEVVLKKGEALVVLASNKNSPSPGSGHEYNLLIETDSGTLHELNFFDLNGTSYRGSTYENKSYGFAYATTSSESRTIAGPCKIRINKNFYVAYKIIRKD